ncbi:MAG: rRNA adenine N-6-methyltransferase family protein [Thermoprotei archaeon]
MEKPPLRRKQLFKWTINILREYGIRPRKKYSQSFVVDPAVVYDFLNNIDPRIEFIEIGCGIGTLSYYIAENAHARGVLIDIDKRLIKITAELVSEHKHIIVLLANALDLDWSFKQVISNTPYHITSDILVKIARSNAVERAVLVLQRDVVERLVATPGTRNYGRLTILMKTLFDLKPGRVYPPSAFYPTPEVYSQMVVLVRRRRYDELIRILEEITRRVFTMRNRKAISVITRLLGINENEAERIGIKPYQRIYELDPGVLLRLAEYVKNIGLELSAEK